jgi:hypothetical protein
MSIRISQQTMIMIHNEAQNIIEQNKNLLEHGDLMQAILGKMREQPARGLLTAEQQADIGATHYFRAQSRIRRRCEKVGDLFRPQLLVPVAPKTLSRLGPGGVLTLTGWQNEDNSKVKGAARIIEEVTRRNSFRTRVIEVLVPRPGYNIQQAMVEFFDYKWRSDDDEPFPVVEVDLIVTDSELSEAADDDDGVA